MVAVFCEPEGVKVSASSVSVEPFRERKKCLRSFSVACAMMDVRRAPFCVGDVVPEGLVRGVEVSLGTAENT